MCPLSVWDIVQTDWTSTAEASLRQGQKSSGTQYTVQDCEAIWVKRAFTAAWATVGFKVCMYACMYVYALCKISYETRQYSLKELKTNGAELVQGVHVWMWVCDTLLFGFWNGFSFLVCSLICLFEL